MQITDKFRNRFSLFFFTCFCVTEKTMEIYPAMELVVSSTDKNMQVSFFSNLAILDWEIRKE